MYKLHKALYGLKQAPRAWYSKIDSYFVDHHFQKSPSELTLYAKKNGIDFMLVCLYADDIIYTGNSTWMLQEFKQSMLK